MKPSLRQPLTPEHDKQSVAVERAITEFLEFLSSQNIMLCKVDPKTDNLYAIGKTHRQVIFDFFGIDFVKWEEENHMLLSYLRLLNEAQK